MIKLFFRSVSPIITGDLKEIRPVDTQVLNYWNQEPDNPVPASIITFKLPESDKFKAEVKMVTVDPYQRIPEESREYIHHPFFNSLEVMLNYFLSL